MSNLRIIPRLDIKGPNLIKGVHLEGLRVVGDPHEHALRYYEAGADELLFIDIVASLYQRNNLSDITKRAADRVYVPITVGGGIRSLADVETMMHSGADKVAINTAAIARPDLVGEVARRYGSQCMVLGIEAKRRATSVISCGRAMAAVLIATLSAPECIISLTLSSERIPPPTVIGT